MPAGTVLAQHQMKFAADASGAATAVTDYSDSVDSLQLPGQPFNQGTISTFGDIDDTKTVGGKVWGNLTITMPYTINAADFCQICEAWIAEDPVVARTLEIDIPDSTSGNRRWSGEFYIMDFQGPQGQAGGGEPQKATAVFAPVNGITMAAIA